MDNPMVNYAKINKEVASNHYNVRDAYKNNTVEQNVAICNNDRLKFSVGCINITGELNIGMMIRSACLFGAKNFYIFGRNKFDKRSTVGAENYINIQQFVYNEPLSADAEINAELTSLSDTKHDIILCEHGGISLGSFTWKDTISPVKGITPLFLFGSESHGIPEIISKNILFSAVSIPQRGVLRSFNVSAAMNIICWSYVQEMYL